MDAERAHGQDGTSHRRERRPFISVLAAWEKKAVVLSGDDTARALFARLSDLGGLGWARIADDDVESWLWDGAPVSRVELRG